MRLQMIIDVKMNIRQYTDKRIIGLFNKFKDSAMTPTELVESLRKEADRSTFLFSFLLERLLVIVFSRGYIILSKGMLKNYLSSDCKEFSDYIYIGGTADDEDENIIKAAHGIVIKKGMFIRIIQKLNLNETLNAYIKFLLIHEEEINESLYLSKKEIKKYSNINSVIETLYKEFDKKVTLGKKLINFNKKSVS